MDIDPNIEQLTYDQFRGYLSPEVSSGLRDYSPVSGMLESMQDPDTRTMAQEVVNAHQNKYLGTLRSNPTYYDPVYSAWQAGQSAPVAPAPGAPTSSPTAPVAPTSTDQYALSALAGGPVNWQGLYDPLQEYYWDSTLGGQTVKTRELLGYGDDLKSLDELRKPVVDPLASSDWTPENPWLSDAYAAKFAKYSDWEDTNIQDFFESDNDYRRGPSANELWSDPSASYTDWNYSLIDPSLRGNEAFKAIGTFDGGAGDWLKNQGFDLREGTGWDPKTWVTGTDANTRAMQTAITSGYNPSLHFNADMTDPSTFMQLADDKKNLFDPVSAYLNAYGKEVGDTDTNFFQHKDNTSWDKAIKDMNPGFVKGLFQSPVGGLLLGMVSGGLGLVGTTGGAVASAMPSLSAGAANAIGAGLVGAGTGAISSAAAGGDWQTGALTGGLSGGLSAVAGPISSSLASTFGLSPELAAALTKGGLSAAGSALTGSDDWLQAGLAGGLGSYAGSYAGQFGDSAATSGALNALTRSTIEQLLKSGDVDLLKTMMAGAGGLSKESATSP